ncbi:hypothetical protein M422DRAFT_44233 [Sphaerobolus stellatus SS14]|nr:hypothetical protein M422DRAFT_44233 [Sphaerobolus stellatus SS14]
MQRLLMCLTPHDKRMILEDWQHQLRRQSLKRDPEHNMLGTDDEPEEFESLIMTDKLDLFHSLCEWQFHNTTNLRLRMRSDDEDANWRIEPIARDSKGNNYWIMGGNRLWRQHAPTRKRPPPPKKRKRPAATSNGRKSAKRKQPGRIISASSTKASTPTTRKWEEFPKQFENSKHKEEKKFYNILVKQLVPAVIEVLREEAQKKVVEEPAVTSERKRSSRLAVKESIRQAEIEAARKKAEEEKELDRHKRWEARTKKEEEERQKRENSRSTRLRERAKREGREDGDEIDIVGEDSEANHPVNGTKEESVPPTTGLPAKYGSKSGTQTPKEDEPWELNCEICHRHGMNLDGSLELMCCEKCNKWQHIRCHDQADLIAGRPQRDWEKEDFFCSACRSVAASTKGRKPPTQRQQPRTQTQAAQYPPLAPQPNWPYNGAIPTAAVNGVAAASRGIQPQPHQVQAHPPLPIHPSLAAAYSNGRPIYPTPPNQATNAAAPFYPGTYTTVYNAYAGPATAAPTVPTQGRALPYSTTPNRYMSDYGQSGYRTTQGSPTPANTQPPAQVPQNHVPPPSAHPAAPLQISHYRPPASSASPPATQPATTSWSPQQVSYQAWAGASGTQPYGANLGATTNGYKAYVPPTAPAYASHPAATTGRPIAAAPSPRNNVSPRPRAATAPGQQQQQQSPPPPPQQQQYYNRPPP